MPLIIAHADVSSRARGQIYGLSLHLYPYFVYASSEGSGESTHMLNLDRVFTLVNVNAPVVATTSWWLHFTAPVVA